MMYTYFFLELKGPGDSLAILNSHANCPNDAVRLVELFFFPLNTTNVSHNSGSYQQHCSGGELQQCSRERRAEAQTP